MELQFLTPTEVWEGFIPSQMNLETSIISAETANNLVCSKQYFTADESAQGRIRAFMEIYYDARWSDKRAAVLLLSHYHRNNTGEIVRELVNEGYAVGVLDYCGAGGEEKTAFPADLSYAVYPDCKNHLDTIETNARNTPWFVWSKIARRALCVLEQQNIVDAAHIGVIGFGIGAEIAWQVTGMDSRVKALVAIDGGGYRWAKGNPRFTVANVLRTDEERAYSTGVGAETYAKFVKCPVLYIASRTSHMTDIDRAGDILSLVQSDCKQLLYTTASETQLTTTAAETLLGWLRAHFVMSGNETFTPSAEFVNADGKLYLRMHTVHKAQKIEVFACYGEELSAARHWTEIKNPQKVDTHVYTINVPVFDLNEYIIAYATFTYENGNAISLPTMCVLPKKMGITSFDPIRESYRIMYEGNMGIGSFASLTDDAILPDGTVLQAEGPFEIKGITATKGGLYFCRSAAEMKALDRTISLHFDVYSPTERELCINMYTFPEMKRFTAYATLDGGEFWQKLLLHSADFKSDEGKTLANFNDTKILVINDVAGIILNNFLWI